MEDTVHQLRRIVWDRRIIEVSVLLSLFVTLACRMGPKPPVPGESWARRIGESFLERHPDALLQVDGKRDTAWTYEQGLMLEALIEMGRFTGDQRYYSFVRQNLGHYVRDDGSIRTYRLDDFNLDMLAGGRSILFLLEATRQKKYRTAADLLRRQLKEQPRTHEGGFWHKNIYPYQMWLDGLYMAEPFYASYALQFNEPEAFDDIANQFSFIYRHASDSVTGLCYHGWDESRRQRWADSSSGHSPSFWGRAMGWYVMGLVDVLDYFPVDHPRRGELIRIFQEMSGALLSFQDSATGMWYQVVDQAGRSGNYFESSASAMFAYAFAKGANMNYLKPRFFSAAERAMQGIWQRCVSVDAAGHLDLKDTCRGAGLGGSPYRDGTYAYYVSVPRATNDMKGIGPLLLAAIEIERRTDRTGR
jgi:unsaturated rhamnogalacturonyl hydrolase